MYTNPRDHFNQDVNTIWRSTILSRKEEIRNPRIFKSHKKSQRRPQDCSLCRAQTN